MTEQSVEALAEVLSRSAVRRLAEVGLRAAAGEDISVELRSWGLEAEYRGWETVVRGQVLTALIPGDPITCAACLGMAVAGTAWVWAFPGLLDEVNRLWREARREEGGKRRS